MIAKIVSYLILFLVLNFISVAQEVKVTRITDKVSVFNLMGVSNCNLVAVSSDDGIVLIDTEISPMTMEIVRDAIIKEFPGKKFKYVINTHAHAHHCGGNAVFKNIPIIAHENIVDDMQWWFDALKDDEMKKNFYEYIENTISECKSSIQNENDKSKVNSSKEILKYWENRRQEIENGFEVIVPNILFSDRMKLQLSDMTIDLIYFGKGHSNSDILVHIPEEKVLISGGAIIDDLPWKYHKIEGEKDISRWISVLKSLKENLNTIKTVIPGHSKFCDEISVKLHYEYLSEMYDKIKSMKEMGKSLEDVKLSLSLDNEFSHFTQFANLPDEEKEKHVKYIEMFWNNININPVESLRYE